MTSPKLIWKLINLINGVLIMLYVFKSMHWFAVLNPIKLQHLLISGAVVYGLRSWFEIKFNVSNQIKSNQITKTIYYLGGGIFILGILFKVMHWPLAEIVFIAGAVTVVLSFILTFFVSEDIETKTSNSEILDDI